MMSMLETVRTHGPPEAWITAGAVRNRVWDHLHGYAEPTALNDIDVIYLASDNLDETLEKRYEAALRQRLPGRPWSVKNQARMAGRNGDDPYRSIGQALQHWCETPTAVGVRLDTDDRIEIIAPLGLGDLFDLVVRPTPFASEYPHKLEQYRDRMAKKNWPRQWPRIRVLDL